MRKKSRRKYLERGFDVKQKAIFIIFKGIPAAKNYLRPESEPLTKQVWNYKPMWHFKYFAILKSKVDFDEMYMTLSKYENMLRRKHANVTLMSFLRLFTETN